MNISDNPFSSVPNSQGWKSRLTLDVFLSHSGDCREICESVKKYLQDDINNALREYALTISPIMYEDWPPSLKSGTATTSSLNGVEFSSVVFAFIYKKHGKIRNDEIFHAIELFKQKKIQDVHVFFKNIPMYHLTKEDAKVRELKQRLEENLTYYIYADHTDVIRKVSQIIIKAICELKKQEGQPVPEEMLQHSGAQLLNNGGVGQ